MKLRKFVLMTVWPALLMGGLAATATAPAIAQDGVSLPPVLSQDGVSYMTGGIGSDESEAFRGQSGHWPLTLQFSTRSGQFLADVHVRVENAGHRIVLDAESTGPYMLVRLKPGQYIVYARYSDIEQKKSVMVGSVPVSASFRWAPQ